MYLCILAAFLPAVLGPSVPTATETPDSYAIPIVSDEFNRYSKLSDIKL